MSDEQSGDPSEQAGDIVKIASERALRMTAVTPDSEQKPIVDAETSRPSAVSPYTAPLSFSWRDQPLGAPEDKKPPTR